MIVSINIDMVLSVISAVFAFMFVALFFVGNVSKPMITTRLLLDIGLIICNVFLLIIRIKTSGHYELSIILILIWCIDAMSSSYALGQISKSGKDDK